MVESSALLKRRTPKGYRGFESLPHRFTREPGNEHVGQVHGQVEQEIKTGANGRFQLRSCNCMAAGMDEQSDKEIANKKQQSDAETRRERLLQRTH